jgi:hypothetical protein
MNVPTTNYTILNDESIAVVHTRGPVGQLFLLFSINTIAIEIKSGTQPHNWGI